MFEYSTINIVSACFTQEKAILCYKIGYLKGEKYIQTQNQNYICSFGECLYSVSN